MGSSSRHGTGATTAQPCGATPRTAPPSSRPWTTPRSDTPFGGSRDSLADGLVSHARNRGINRQAVLSHDAGRAAFREAVPGTERGVSSFFCRHTGGRREPAWIMAHRPRLVADGLV